MAWDITEKEIRHKLKDTNSFDSLFTKEIENGIKLIIGKNKDGKTEIQSVHFDKEKWTEEKAKEWISKHNFEDEYKEERKEFEENKLFSTVKDIFAVGNWKGEDYTENDLDNIVDNFNILKKERKDFKVPLKIDFFEKLNKAYHGGQPAVGIITDLKRIGTKLYAYIENIPKKVKELIDNKAYTGVSSEIFWNYKNGNNIMKKVLSAVALIGVEHPGCYNLEDFGKIYIENNESEIKKIYFYEVENKKKEEIKMGEEKKEFEEKLEAEKRKFDEEKKIIEKEKEVIEKKYSELANSQKEYEIRMFIDEQKKAGKLLPKHDEIIKTILINSENSKMVKFTDGKEMNTFELIKLFFESMPKLVEFKEKTTEGKISKEEIAKEKKYNDTELFKEFQFEEGLGSEESQKLHFITTKISNDKKIDYNQARIEVKKTYPELFV